MALEGVPAGDIAIFAICELYSLPFAFDGVERLRAGESWSRIIASWSIALALMLFGILFPWLRKRLGTKISNWLDRLVHNIRLWFALGFLVGMCTVAVPGLFILKIRSDLDTYVMPRVLTKQQAVELHKLLTEHAHVPVVLKYDHYDPETESYAGQWADVLANAGWPLTSDTDESQQPYARAYLNLCVVELGNPPDPEHSSSAATLTQALGIAGGDQCSGKNPSLPGYKLFLVVGHRPLELHKKPPILTRLGQWLERKANE